MSAPHIAGQSPVPAAIDCETAVRRLWDYLDNRLPAISHGEVEAHLATCVLCAPHFAFAQSMQRALAASASADQENPGDAIAAESRLRERVREALRADRSGSPTLDADVD